MMEVCKEPYLRACFLILNKVRSLSNSTTELCFTLDLHSFACHKNAESFCTSGTFAQPTVVAQDLDGVMKEEGLALMDRVAFACRFMPDQHLSDAFEQLLENKVRPLYIWSRIREFP